MGKQLSEQSSYIPEIRTGALLKIGISQLLAIIQNNEEYYHRLVLASYEPEIRKTRSISIDWCEPAMSHKSEQ